MAPCWGDRDSWEEWLLLELRHRYLALCGLPVHLHEVHASINDLDACYDPGRTVLYVRVRVDGFFDEGAVWSPAMITCLAMVEQLGLFVACQQRGHCRCYLNGSPLHAEPVAANHGDFLAIYKSDHARSDVLGHAMLSTASTRRLGGSTGTVSECPSGQSAAAASDVCSEAELSPE